MEPGQLRIDEAVEEAEPGARRIGETKTVGSHAYVGISEGLQEEIDIWIQARRRNGPTMPRPPPPSQSCCFPARPARPSGLATIETVSEAARQARRHFRYDVPGPAAYVRDAFPEARQPARYPVTTPTFEA